YQTAIPSPNTAQFLVLTPEAQHRSISHRRQKQETSDCDRDRRALLRTPACLFVVRDPVTVLVLKYPATEPIAV
ncbi:Protein of unknown function, partial [Cotesia congregata]